MLHRASSKLLLNPVLACNLALQQVRSLYICATPQPAFAGFRVPADLYGLIQQQYDEQNLPHSRLYQGMNARRLSFDSMHCLQIDSLSFG